MILPVIALLLWLCGFLVLWRIPLCRRAEEDRPGIRRVSVIIPARNEEHNLPRLLDSLEVQEVRPLEVLVVDDASTDGTAEVARESGAAVITSEPLPRGWKGKTWACHQGAAAARGDILLFMDADTWLEPGGLRRILETYLSEGGVMSVGPYHRTERVYEDLSLYFNLMMTMGIGAFTVFGDKNPPVGLFGQFLVLDAVSYRESGGHSAVRAHTLENMYLAERLRMKNIPFRCFGGRGSLCMRMYPAGIRDLIDGWSKAFISGAARVPLPLISAIVAWITGSILAAAMLVLAAAGYSGVSALWMVPYPLFCAQIAIMSLRIGSFGSWSYIFYPFTLFFYFAVLTRAALKRTGGSTMNWKGRDILPAERTGQDAG